MVSAQAYDSTKTSYGFNFQASKSWTGMSTSASPFTSSLGSGTSLDITPSFFTLYISGRG